MPETTDSVFLRPVLLFDKAIPIAKPVLLRKPDANPPKRAASDASLNASSIKDARDPLSLKDINKATSTRSIPFRNSSASAAAAATKSKLSRDVLKPKISGVSKTYLNPKHAAGESSISTRSTVSLNPQRFTSPSKIGYRPPRKARPPPSPLKGRSPKKHRKAEKLEHPLHVYFKEASETYLHRAITHLPLAIQTTIDTLSIQLNQTSLTSQSLITTALAADKALARPLAEEELIITTTSAASEANLDGKPIQARTTIGERMEAFEKLLAEESAKLKGLWVGWCDVNGRLKGMLDPLQDDETGFTARYRKLDEGYALKRDGLLEAFKAQCEEAVEAVRDSEKAFEVNRKIQRKKFLDFMKMDMLV